MLWGHYLILLRKMARRSPYRIAILGQVNSLGRLRYEEQISHAFLVEKVRSMPEQLQRLIGYELKGKTTLSWLDGQGRRTTLAL